MPKAKTQKVWGGCWSSTSDGTDYVFCFGFDAVGDKINQMYLKSAYDTRRWLDMAILWVYPDT